MSEGYTPDPPPVPGYSGPPAPDQLQRQKKLGRIIVLVVIGVVLLIVLFVGGLAVMAFGWLRSSEAYQHGVQVATTDPRVSAELGAPVKPSWLFSGSVQEVGPSGTADLSIDLKGSRRNGTLYVVAKKSAGRWKYEVLELRCEGQPDLDLLPSPATTPEAK